MAKPSRATNAVKIGFSVLWEVKIDNDIHRLDIDTTSKKIGANKIATYTISKIVKYSVPMILKHLCMAVEA